MEIVFRTEDQLVMGEFKHITGKYEDGFLIVTFCNEYENIDIDIACDEDKVAKILDKIYLDIWRDHICILDNETSKQFDN
jgi:hypothetical protein